MGEHVLVEDTEEGLLEKALDQGEHHLVDFEDSDAKQGNQSVTKLAQFAR